MVIVLVIDRIEEEPDRHARGTVEGRKINDHVFPQGVGMPFDENCGPICTVIIGHLNPGDIVRDLFCAEDDNRLEVFRGQVVPEHDLSILDFGKIDKIQPDTTFV